jgi:hypothetical protein
MQMENQETLGEVLISSTGTVPDKVANTKAIFAVMAARHPAEGVLGIHVVFSLEQAETFFDEYENGTTDESCARARQVLTERGIPQESENQAVIASGPGAMFMAMTLDMAAEYHNLSKMMGSGLAMVVKLGDGDDDLDPDDGPIDPSRLN